MNKGRGKKMGIKGAILGDNNFRLREPPGLPGG